VPLAAIHIKLGSLVTAPFGSAEFGIARIKFLSFVKNLRNPAARLTDTPSGKSLGGESVGGKGLGGESVTIHADVP